MYLDKNTIKEILETTVPSFQLTSKDDLNLGFGGIYYALTRALRPKNVVVIGSKAGFAPILFGLALKHNSGSYVESVMCEDVLLRDESTPSLHFIDPSYSIGRDENHWYGLGNWDDPNKVKTLWNKFGIDNIVKHYKMTSQDYLKNKDAKNNIDLLFIDGDHSYEGIMHDFLQFYDRLSPDAIVLAHDVDPQLKEDDSESIWSDKDLNNNNTGGYKAYCDVSDELYEKFRLPVYPGLAIMRKKNKSFR